MKPKIPSVVRNIALAILALWAAACGLILVSGLSDRARSADVGVVPGSKVYRSGLPSPSLQSRLDEALVVYRRGLVKNLFVSGGLGKEGFDESQVMRAYLVAHGVPAVAIVTDSHGDNTFATARHTATLMRQRHWTSAFVITQYFHVPRTRLALRACGVNVAGWAHARYFDLRDFYSVPREALGYPVYGLEHC
ncbi:MAG TPA: YdcF family protein [Caulobacteraceae bacterium]|jgi:vancomycin permeability regulator SanA|nr:YdcF family protein [Caulobacteraceae bacterium]